jgi:acetyltransferase
MDFFFNPKAIALIGATPNPKKGGYAIFKNLQIGFKGPIYPVNPRYDQIEGIQCYGAIDQVPGPVDLAIVFVPALLTPETVSQCAKKGIPGVIVESGGFAEVGETGNLLQKQLQKIVQETGIRVWGPNCMGLVDTKKGWIFSFVTSHIWKHGLKFSPVSFIVQSGMLSGAFLMDIMTHGRGGAAKVCSIGNKVDVEECELLEFLINDPDTKVIGLYLESIPRGRQFVSICRQSTKPIVLLKGGKSIKGSAAAMSHTASLSGETAVIEGAMAHAGVIQASDFMQLLDFCQILALAPRPAKEASGRLAVLTYSGGAGIVTTDIMEAHGLQAATLSAQSKEMLSKVFPDWMPVSNPVDLWPAVEKNGAKNAYGAAVMASCQDPMVDGIFLHAYAGGFALNPDLEPLARLMKESGKPVVCWLLGERQAAAEFQKKAVAVGIPVYREISRAVECLAAVFDSRRYTRPSVISNGSGLGLPRELENLFEKTSGGLDEQISKKILKASGIPVVDETLAASPEEALKAAKHMGFAVVMKGMTEGVFHKTEKGLVKTGISDPAHLLEVYTQLIDIMGGKGNVLVQRQISPGIEIIAGLVRDPQFGPCVMCGMGGVFTEVLEDRVFSVAPVDHKDALDMIGRLKSQKLLDGYRGFSPVNRDALAEILVNVGHLGMAYPRLKEIDINPIMMDGMVPTAVDALIVLED